MFLIIAPAAPAGRENQNEWVIPVRTLTEKATAAIARGGRKARTRNLREVRLPKWGLMTRFFVLLLLLISTVNLAAQSRQSVGVNFVPVGGARSETGESSAAAAALERHAFDSINRKRVERGMAPLEWSNDLAKVARLHSRNMADFKFFSHRGIDGSLVDDRADKFGISNWRAIGENIAFNRGYAHPDDFAVESWMGSTAHRENLLNRSWIESAIGIAVSPDGSYYFTQVFLLRK
jgi:uncharacterized protein YkwD